MERNILDEIQKQARLIELELICQSRLGWITKVDEKKDAIWINYQGNPLQVDLLALLGTPFLTLENLKDAESKNMSVEINFKNNDPQKPIIRDIYFSVAELNKKGQQAPKNKTLYIQADRIVLDGTTEVIIKSGDAKTVYQADGNKISDEADRIDSSAKGSNKIKGGIVKVN